MKKKYSIELHSAENQTILEQICMMIALHNGGKDGLDMDTIIGYFKAYQLRYDYPEASLTFNEEQGKLSLFMKPGEPFLTIEEKVIYELNSVPENN